MRNGKRIFNSAFKSWLVEETSWPGMSATGLALRHGVTANQLRRWMRLRHLRDAPSSAVMLPVTIAHAPMPAYPASAGCGSRAPIEIELGSAVVRVRDSLDAQQLCRVIDALRT